MEERPLPLGTHISDRVEKGGVHFYRIDLSTGDVQRPFAITAQTTGSNRLKLLLFDKNEAGGWSLKATVSGQRRCCTCNVRCICCWNPINQSINQLDH